MLTNSFSRDIITKLSRERGAKNRQEPASSTLKNEQREKRTEACRLALGAGLWAEVTLENFFEYTHGNVSVQTRKAKPAKVTWLGHTL